MLALDRSFAFLGSARSGERTGGPRVCLAPAGALSARTYASDTLWFMPGRLPRTLFDSCADIYAPGTQWHSLLRCCVGRTKASTFDIAPPPSRPNLSGLRQAYPSFHPCPRTLDRRASPLSILNNSHGRCGTRHCASKDVAAIAGIKHIGAAILQILTRRGWGRRLQ